MAESESNSCSCFGSRVSDSGVPRSVYMTNCVPYFEPSWDDKHAEVVWFLIIWSWSRQRYATERRARDGLATRRSEAARRRRGGGDGAMTG
eukprot:1175386-Prorocentrum_minimum.AAC.2